MKPNLTLDGKPVLQFLEEMYNSSKEGDGVVFEPDEIFSLIHYVHQTDKQVKLLREDNRELYKMVDKLRGELELSKAVNRLAKPVEEVEE